MADSNKGFEESNRKSGERALYTRRKGLQNKIKERAEESDEAAVRRERFVGRGGTKNTNGPIGDCRRSPPDSNGPQLPAPLHMQASLF